MTIKATLDVKLNDAFSKRELSHSSVFEKVIFSENGFGTYMEQKSIFFTLMTNIAFKLEILEKMITVIRLTAILHFILYDPYDRICDTGNLSVGLVNAMILG